LLWLQKHNRENVEKIQYTSIKGSHYIWSKAIRE